MSQDEEITRAQVEGRRAAETGVLHSSNPYPFRDYQLHLAWSNAWLTRTIEIEEHCKLITPEEFEA